MFSFKQEIKGLILFISFNFLLQKNIFYTLVTFEVLKFDKSKKFEFVTFFIH